MVNPFAERAYVASRVALADAMLPRTLKELCMVDMHMGEEVTVRRANTPLRVATRLMNLTAETFTVETFTVAVYSEMNRE